MVDRRRFLGGAACSLTSGWMSRYARASGVAEGQIEISLGEVQESISPDLYGYLLENLGTVIYDGVWVGEDSPIPNVGGIRKELIDRMREIKASVIRWPGGNFADYYDWRDGIGPRATRPRRTNMWSNEMPKEAPPGPQRYDPNQFGTPEFLRLCELSGGRAFLSANVRSLPAQEFTRWVEYCNSPAGSTTLADQRKADGSLAPYGVRYWGIGNEVWAAGGDLTAEAYATLYKRFTANVPNYGVELAFIACGSPPPTIGNFWVRDFMRACKQTLFRVPIAAMSVHYYATDPLEDMPPGQTVEQFHPEWSEAEWLKAIPDAVAFDATDWYEVLAKSAKMERVLESCWKTLEEFDPKHQVKIAVDEWGISGRPGTELSPLNITGRTVTLRDALASALTLDVFHRHAEKLLLACFTGLINQEGGLFRAEGRRFVATPIYYVFKLYAAHQDGHSVRTTFDFPRIRYDQRDGTSGSMWALNGSASVREGKLTLTVVNPHVSAAVDSEIILRGGKATGGAVTTLTNSDIHAQNTFDNPERVKPVMAPLEVRGSAFRHRFPPASVSCLTLDLTRV